MVIAFIVAGLVMLLTGSNPFKTYGAIFDGTGLNWLFPWVTGQARTIAAQDLQQTLVATAPLILTGLSVAFAFRAGLFNIGAQGQYTVGAVIAVWVATSFTDMNPVLHIIVWRSSLAALIGAALGGDRRLAEGGRRHARGDLHDHAQLDRDLGRGVPVPGGRPAAGQARARATRSPTRSPTTCTCR